MADIPESTKMLPCPNPWCENIRGVEAARHITTAKWHICCGDCLIDGPWSDTCDLAIAAWNTRAAPPAMDREAVEKVRALLEERIANYSGLCDQAVDAGTDENGYALATEALERTLADLSTLSADAIRQGEGLDYKVAAFVADYEFRGDDGDFTPNDWTKTIIEDAIHGFLAEHLPATPASHASDGGE